MTRSKTRKIILGTVLGLVLIFILLALIGLLVPVGNQRPHADNLFPSDISLLGFDASRKHQRVEPEAYTSEYKYNEAYSGNTYSWTSDRPIEFNIDSKMGDYQIAIDYRLKSKNVRGTRINIDINGTKYDNLELQSSWHDGSDEVIYDIYRNQVPAIQKPLDIWRNSYLYDQRYYQNEPLLFKLSNGDNKITIDKNDSNIELGNIYIVEAKNPDAYEMPKNESNLSNEGIILEAERPLLRSTPEIKAKAEQNTKMTPYSTKYNMLNTITGDSFNQSGYSLSYAFKVEKAGNYNISLKYYISQTNTSVYTKIFIDNLILNKELNRYELKENGGFNNETLNANNENMQFYFDEGIHTITIQLDASLQAPIYEGITNIIEEISALYLEIVKLTGGNTDKNMHWNVCDYIPDIKDRLNSWKSELEGLLELTNRVSKSNAKKQNRLYQNLKNAYDKLLPLVAEPNQIPHKLNILSEGSSSISTMLSDSLHTSTFSPLSLDKIYIHSDDYKIPSAKANIFMNFFGTIQRVFKSGVEKRDKDAVEIWVNRSTYYVSLMQQYADAYYTPETGVKIRFSLLPDESKITYANASGTNPDAALGVSSAVPYDMGIRGALVDLSKLEGFNETIRSFAPGALTNMIECDKVYGLPETQDFIVTFYRRDILSKLGIEVPNTYDELIKILPELQRYGMNYYMPLAGGSGLKGIGTTAPFIYQYGGDIYSDDYMSTAIDSKEAIEAINMMVNLFSIYSLPLTSQNFYDSFRNGLIPVGIAGFDLYLKLLTAAPEIQGRWDIALAPGVLKNGEINRTNTANTNGVVLFKKSKRTKEAWEFVKWWLSADIQASFANDIQASYGPTFLWNTANLDALKNIGLPKEHVDLIIEQAKYLYNVPQTPATYIIERGISDAWNKAVFNQIPVRAAISDAVLEINKEIRRKMTEFSYLDSKGEIIKVYYVPSTDEIKKWIR